jgi:membrane protease YdiL (CAAX protease family)
MDQFHVRKSLQPYAVLIICMTTPIVLVSFISAIYKPLCTSIYFDFTNTTGMALGICLVSYFFHLRPPALRPSSNPFSLEFSSILAGVVWSTADLKLLSLSPVPSGVSDYGRLHSLFTSNHLLEAGLLLIPVCLGYPVLEEIIFRGLFQSALASRTGRKTLAALVTAGAFALMHLNCKLEILPVLDIFALSLVLSWLTFRSSSLLPAICLHAAFNTTQVALLAMGFRFT